jgi:hypothetical protein
MPALAIAIAVARRTVAAWRTVRSHVATTFIAIARRWTAAVAITKSRTIWASVAGAWAVEITIATGTIETIVG